MMPVTADELRICLNRMLDSGHIVSESPVYLLSRDGEQLRAIGNTRYRPGVRVLTIERGDEEEPTTLKVVDVVMLCRSAHPESTIKLIADGFGEANAEPLESVQLGCELLSLKRDQANVDHEETNVVLCT